MDSDNFLVNLIVAITLSAVVIYGAHIVVRVAGEILINSQRPSSCNLEEYK